MVSKPFKSIRKNSEYLELKNKGQKIWASSWMLISYMSIVDDVSIIGISISRKIGNAVIRNKIKRWIRAEVHKFLVANPDIRLKMTFFIKPMGVGFYRR
ncbi:MAG: ribonuclease P protein component, partial [Bdellovibrionales bacterium]|nr:ribonuclease P protein component [Bdellovibrionales bacterium]